MHVDIAIVTIITVNVGGETNTPPTLMHRGYFSANKSIKLI